MRMFRIRSIGHHTIAAPPLPPPGGFGQCRAIAASTGRRCRLDAGETGYCGHFGHRPPPPKEDTPA
jgi:hypothetical protein